MAPRSGFPTSFGNKRVSIFETVGPASYTQYTAPSTGGQTLQGLPDAGVKIIDQAYGAVSADGLHRAEVVQIEQSTVGGVAVGDTQIRLKWYVVATGAEVAAMVDLSTVGKTVRILVIGDR